MLSRRQTRILFCAFVFSLFFYISCAGRCYLLVDYQVPNATQKLKGLTIRLNIKDQREPQTFLTPAASDQFPQFSGIFSLAWIMPNQERILAGEHQVPALFQTTFKKRLTDHGIGTTDDDNTAVPLLTIRINQFTLDSKNHKWIAELAYDAVLSQPSHPTAKESIHGNAERVQVIGRKGADTVISEIFSDVINRLDLLKLFKSAQIHPNE